jgi:hypothetical protein
VHIKDPSSITAHQNLQALVPDQEISTIPTIVNGVITNGKKKSPCNNVHKVLINGDSHMRNCAVNVKSSVKNNLVQGVVKPGAMANILVNSAKNEVKGLSKRDIVVICGGANDIGRNNSSTALHQIMDFVANNTYTNVALN